MTDTGNEASQPSVANVVRPAGARVGAAFIDLALLIGLFVIMAQQFGTWGDGEARLDGLPALAYFFLALSYFIVMEARFGWTIGKRLCGLRVVANDASPITLSQSFKRNLLRIVDGMPLFYFVGFCAMMSDKKRLRIGDRVARTVVIRAAVLPAVPTAVANVGGLSPRQ